MPRPSVAPKTICVISKDCMLPLPSSGNDQGHNKAEGKAKNFKEYLQAISDNLQKLDFGHGAID